MSAARIIQSLGASVSLTDGKLKLAGLDRLDKETAACVLEVARNHKTEIVAELRGLASAGLQPGLAELDRFFATAIDHEFPDGTKGWIDPGYLQELERKDKGKRHGRA